LEKCCTKIPSEIKKWPSKPERFCENQSRNIILKIIFRISVYLIKIKAKFEKLLVLKECFYVLPCKCKKKIIYKKAILNVSLLNF